MSTPHNEADKGDIARVVLMPGDPLRARFIAETYLDDPVCFNHVRGMLGFTGTYKGVKVSVMGSGMGMPSIGIYSYELYSQYGVDCIIRVGTAGSLREDIKVLDVMLVTGAYSESTYGHTQNGSHNDCEYPSSELNKTIQECARELGIPLAKGIVHSSDVFYAEPGRPTPADYVREHDCSAVEMESFALFHNADTLDKQAACILTISDSMVTPEATTSQERETTFTTMMELALESAIKIQAD